MISGEGWDLNFPEICLTVEGKKPNKTQPGKQTRSGIEFSIADNDVFTGEGPMCVAVSYQSSFSENYSSYNGKTGVSQQTVDNV